MALLAGSVGNLHIPRRLRIIRIRFAMSASIKRTEPYFTPPGGDPVFSEKRRASGRTQGLKRRTCRRSGKRLIPWKAGARRFTRLVWSNSVHLTLWCGLQSARLFYILQLYPVRAAPERTACGSGDAFPSPRDPCASCIRGSAVPGLYAG